MKCGLHVVVIVRDEGGTKACGGFDCTPVYGSAGALFGYCFSYRNKLFCSEFQVDMESYHISARKKDIYF